MVANKIRASFGVRLKLVVLGVLVVLVVSSAFTWINLSLTRRAIEEDLQARAIVYAREVAATFDDRRELAQGGTLRQLIDRLREIRRSVLQLDVLVFTGGAANVVATSQPGGRLPFTRRDADNVRAGRVVSRTVTTATERYWEVMAPIVLEGSVAGAVAVKFSTVRADELAERIRFWAVTLGAASVLLTGLLMSVTIELVVARPIHRFMTAISSDPARGMPAPVALATSDEFGVLARHFNEMVTRIDRFNEELRARIADATVELDRRYREVEGLNTLLFEMQRRLGHAERLALSGRLMAEVAHEVGTPLHSVAGHLELLGKDLAPGARTPDVARRLRIIESQVARVIEIISTLLDVTRRVPVELQPVDVERLTHDMAELVRPGAVRAGLSLDVRIAPGLPPVRARDEQLQQVILNLLTNAIDATPAGGRIEVIVGAGPGAGEVRIAVVDTGCGIADADRKRIFEPFFSTKEPGRGTGLGLFISAAIMREHDGRIEVESEQGRGTVVQVVLPVGAPGT